ncbi:MAG: DUF86 domain-containing protein [Candidatus Lindowbacteria bacterium]|nr:DUF86 domain-containing protein [Candidatus Lindowbacteria bacterium]
MKDDRVYLDHILECLEWIHRYIGEGREAFLADRKTQSAVLRELQTLAESTQRLSIALKKAHTEVSWQGIAGFRNVLVHDYLGIKLPRIWEIIEKDLPELRAAAENMLRELDERP